MHHAPYANNIYNYDHGIVCIENIDFILRKIHLQIVKRSKENKNHRSSTMVVDQIFDIGIIPSWTERRFRFVNENNQKYTNLYTKTLTFITQTKKR